jgi:hypothetical protein
MVATQEREANHGVFEITRGDVHVRMYATIVRRPN